MGGLGMDPHTKNRLSSHRQMQSYSNSVTSYLLIVMWVVVSLSHAQAYKVSAPGPRWYALEAVANRIPRDRDGVIQKETYSHYLWNRYKRSTRLERPKVVYEISETLKQLAYRDTRLDLIGLILFGPENSRSILDRPYSRQDVYEKENVFHCLKKFDVLFKKHCGPPTHYGLRHLNSENNICLYVKKMPMIEEAIIATCGLNNVAPPMVDLENQSTNIMPTPIHGSDILCGRVSVCGISRMKLQNYAKSYKVIFETDPHQLHEKVQICFHRNASRGLCECEKDEWRPIQKWSQDSLLSPYEQRFVDVKLTNTAYGYVTMTLVEVPLALQLLCYVMLAGGVCLLLLSASTDVLNQNAARSDRIGKWVMRVAGVIAIFQSSFDTPMAMVALASSLALLYAITFIRSTLTFKKKEFLAWKELRESWIKDDDYDVADYVAKWSSVHDFRDWVLKNPNRIIVLPDDNSQVS